MSFVAALSLAVIAVAAWLAPKREQADRWTARILLGSLCILSMVVIASALFRMYTYSEKFGLTRMRVWIFTVEIWLAVLFALVVVCCWKLRASWLPRAVLASGALALLGLAAATRTRSSPATTSTTTTNWISPTCEGSPMTRCPSSRPASSRRGPRSRP